MVLTICGHPSIITKVVTYWCRLQSAGIKTWYVNTFRKYVLKLGVIKIQKTHNARYPCKQQYKLAYLVSSNYGVEHSVRENVAIGKCAVIKIRLNGIFG